MKLEMLVVMVLALASTNLSATEDVAVPVSEPGQAAPATIEGRIAALEAELAKARVELKESQRKLSALAVENARLKGLCRQAGIDPTEKPVIVQIEPQFQDPLVYWDQALAANERGVFWGNTDTVDGAPPFLGTPEEVRDMLRSITGPDNLLTKWEASPEFGIRFWIDPNRWAPLDPYAKWELMNIFRWHSEVLTGKSNIVIYSAQDDTRLAHVEQDGTQDGTNTFD